MSVSSVLYVVSVCLYGYFTHWLTTELLGSACLCPPALMLQACATATVLSALALGAGDHNQVFVHVQQVLPYQVTFPVFR